MASGSTGSSVASGSTGSSVASGSASASVSASSASVSSFHSFGKIVADFPEEEYYLVDTSSFFEAKKLERISY